MPRKKKSSFGKDKPSKLASNLEKTILQYIAGKRYTPVDASELAEQLSIIPAHRELFEEILDKLVAEKTLICKKNLYQLPKHEQQLATGPISVHIKGFGFVKTGLGPDVFIPKHAMQGAVDGDTVEIEISSEVSPKGPEGTVVAILKRSRSHIACTVTSQSKSGYLAYSPLMGPDKPILLQPMKDLPLQEGDRVICLVTTWHNERDLVEASAIRRIGHISDPSVDIGAAIEEFELPHEFTLEAIKEAKQYGKRIGTKETKQRRDFTDWEIVTIDPDTARDFDDAISLTTDSKGHFHLGVHIADVAHYVKPGTHLDEAAFTRCNSTYFPGRCVPMLPEELSNELCSLKPNVMRLTQSVLAEFDQMGKLVHVEICRGVIKSKKRFTYKEAFLILQKKKKSIHSPLLERMTQLCALFKQQRMERGSIDFAMADNVVIVDEKGVPQGLERVEYDITHQMIEEFMLKANELVALELARRGLTLIYRVHEEPNPESFQEFYAFARSLGLSVPAEPNHLDIQKIFSEAKDSPFFPQLSVSFIRSMRVACYSPDNLGHYGLALEHYCHFTSPIRRYTDLIIQRLLFQELPQGTDLVAVAAACSEKERISFRAENSVVLLKKLRLAKIYFDEDPSRIYSAIVTKIKPFAIFFEVADFDLEGTLHVSQIGQDFYEYHAVKMQFRGAHTGEIYSIGQPVHVRLDRLDLTLRQTEWSIVSTVKAPKGKTKKKKHRKGGK